MRDARDPNDACRVLRRGRASVLARSVRLGRAGLAAAAFSLLACLPAGAVDDAVRERIKGVVEQQLRAFGADDGAAAYALASPAIRGMFPSPENFMGMVRQGYAPVYRSRSHTFGEVRDVESGLEQVVQIEDADGIGWTAVYTLERQPDGSWAIAGCRLVRAPYQAA